MLFFFCNCIFHKTKTYNKEIKHQLKLDYSKDINQYLLILEREREKYTFFTYKPEIVDIKI